MHQDTRADDTATVAELAAEVRALRAQVNRLEQGLTAAFSAAGVQPPAVSARRRRIEHSGLRLVRDGA